MSQTKFNQILTKELARIDQVKTSKRFERVITGFTQEACPKAIINGQKVRIFNSNDYLGLRHHHALKQAEHLASQQYGTGPGAVRFISGSLKIHRDLETAIARFHDRADAMVFSSAFAANLAVIFSLIQGQSKDSWLDNNVLVVSDALNHRSIIDGIRLANLPTEQKQIFQHLDIDDLDRILKQHKTKFSRALIISDGVFSMLGEYQHLKKLRQVVDKYSSIYPLGTLLIIDDAHGVGAAGKKGRGSEKIAGVKADLLVGTFGKAFGSDGGYVVGDKLLIDYLRESAATYIYSNSITPGTAGAALAALKLIDQPAGSKLLANLAGNIAYFKQAMQKNGFKFAADSVHPIQPVLIGDPVKNRALADGLFQENILVTNLSYPIVSPDRDEIRVQLSAVHSRIDVKYLVDKFALVGKKLHLI